MQYPGAAKGPDRQAALNQYRLRANGYDDELALFESIRHDAIARLELPRGATVLDVGCGTGLSFALLREAVGPRGRVVGIEQCPEMLAKASERVARNGWTRMTLVNAPAETAHVPFKADAALFHFTHDILLRPEAIANIVHRLKPGAHVVAAGLQWAAPWAWLTNAFVLAAASHSVTSLEGLGRPWSRLAEQVGELDVTATMMGGVYIASGVFSA